MPEIWPLLEKYVAAKKTVTIEARSAVKVVGG